MRCTVPVQAGIDEMHCACSWSHPWTTKGATEGESARACGEASAASAASSVLLGGLGFHEPFMSLCSVFMLSSPPEWEPSPLRLFPEDPMQQIERGTAPVKLLLGFPIQLHCP